MLAPLMVNRPPKTHPTPAAIKKFRARHHLTQVQAAALAESSLRTWCNWEWGDRRMHPAIWAWIQHAVTIDPSPE